jgi:hypothetical protein
MSSLPAEQARKIARGNQRATVRYRCAPAATGKLFLADDQECQRAWLINLSKRGLGLMLARPLPIGSTILVNLRGNDRRTLYELSGHVVHVTLQTQTDWLIGCELITALSDDDLDAIL